eukprot:5246113-Prymnesium_polylepis.2
MSLNAVELPNCLWHTSNGLLRWHVHQLPPGPWDVTLALVMCGPSMLTGCIPGTRLASLVRCVLSDTIVQQSTWLKSSKQCDVDCSTRSPHAPTSARRTSAHSPDMSTTATASCATARLSSAVPGHSQGHASKIEAMRASAHRTSSVRSMSLAGTDVG